MSLETQTKFVLHREGHGYIKLIGNDNKPMTTAKISEATEFDTVDEAAKYGRLRKYVIFKVETTLNYEKVEYPPLNEFVPDADIMNRKAKMTEFIKELNKKSFKTATHAAGWSIFKNDSIEIISLTKKNNVTKINFKIFTMPGQIGLHNREIGEIAVQYKEAIYGLYINDLLKFE